MTRLWLAVALLSTNAAFAGDISKRGDAVEVESYRCVAVSERSIVCKNIGRVCQAAQLLATQTMDHYLGCGLDEWKARHPKETCPGYKGWNSPPSECLPMSLGGM